jgi:hypothetical protein
MTSASNLSSAKKAILSQHALLESLVAIATKHFNDQILGVTQRLVGALLDAGELDAKAVYQRVKSGNLLKENSYAYVHLATTEMELALRRELEQLVPALKKARSAAAELALVPFEEMDNKMAFDAIARPFEFKYAAQIANLNVRLGVMLDREILRTGQNPFRPDVLLGVLHQAWCEFEPESAAHTLLPPLLRPDVLFDFAPMYDALCDALVKKGAQAGSLDALHIRKSENAAAARQARARQKADLTRQLRKFLDEEGDAPQAEHGIPLIPDLPQVSGPGGWRPSGAAGFNVNAPAAAQEGGAAARRFESGGAAFTQGAGHGQLLDLLKNLQARVPEQLMRHAAGGQDGGQGGGAPASNVFYLPRLKESMKGSLSRADESTIDLLSKIFETVYLDPHIPAEIRELIQFLQIPVLRAALADKDFFFEEAHPARRMIDLMSRLGMEEHRGPDDPLFQAMRRSVDRVGRDADGASAAFSEALADLEQSVRQDEESAQTAIAAPIAAALKQEKKVAASRSAQSAVAARIGSGQVVAMLETFLEDKWTAVLTLAYTVEDEKPGAVGNATRTMDDLIWSVKPKITREERRALIARLPGLLATLNRWLDVIKWNDEARVRFFAELAECHASIVRAPLDISPERQLEIAVEVAQQDALRRLEKEQQAAREPVADVDDAALAIEALERGQWLAFTQPDGGARKVKLAWISPLRSLFIFSTATRQEAFSIQVEKLQAAFRDKRVQVLRMDGVVGRALQDAMQEAGNDPGAAAA